MSADYLLNGQEADGRYQDTLAILDGLTDQQLKLANEVLTCMIQFGNPAD